MQFSLGHLYLGKEKDAVEGVVKILDKRYSSQWESYNYVAVMDGNLVSFMKTMAGCKKFQSQ